MPSILNPLPNEKLCRGEASLRKSDDPTRIVIPSRGESYQRDDDRMSFRRLTKDQPDRGIPLRAFRGSCQ